MIMIKINRYVWTKRFNGKGKLSKRSRLLCTYCVLHQRQDFNLSIFNKDVNLLHLFNPTESRHLRLAVAMFTLQSSSSTYRLGHLFVLVTLIHHISLNMLRVSCGKRFSLLMSLKSVLMIQTFWAITKMYDTMKLDTAWV